MKWTLINPAGTNDPDTGDIYSGLDRFGRVKDNRWLDGAGDDLDRIQYGYDRAGNRIWRRNVVAAALGKEFDELYGYDGIHRLKHMARGTLNGGRTALTSETFAQCWTLDSTGNWQGFREDDDGNGTWDLIQQRSANAVNEISGISETTGPSWVTPAYSRAGNMTTMPQPADPTQSYTATYDAWNRLVKIADGADTVSEYAYDGAKRRIVQKSYTGGVLDETRHLYYTEPAQWQVIEERVGTSPDSADAERQFVWGRRYVDNLVLRDRDADDDGALDERLYACADGLFSVSVIVTESGSPIERYSYSAYGFGAVLDSEFQPQSSSGYSWETFFAGYRLDAGSAIYSVRLRSYHSLIGSWLQRDPARYHDSMNLYEYVTGRPLDAVDPSGAIAPVIFIGVVLVCAWLCAPNEVGAPGPGETCKPTNAGNVLIGGGIAATVICGPGVLQQLLAGGCLTGAGGAGCNLSVISTSQICQSIVACACLAVPFVEPNYCHCCCMLEATNPGWYTYMGLQRTDDCVRSMGTSIECRCMDPSCGMN